VDCSKQKESYEGGEEVTKVVHKLGNNGKLVFTYVPQNIDIPVEKIWVGGTGVVADLTIQMDLYHVILPETGSELVEHVQTIQLTAETGWKGIFKDVPELKEGFYAVVEKVPDGYRAQYQGLTRSLLIDGKKVLAAVVDTTTTDATANTVQTVLVTNIPAVILPETGGAGVEVFYALGGLLIAAALVYIAGNGILRRKEVQ
jgi:LPXTG-motif cell wall-anchored protein